MVNEGRSAPWTSSLPSPHVTAPGFRIVLIFFTSLPIMLVRFSRFSSLCKETSALLGLIVGGLDANDWKVEFDASRVGVVGALFDGCRDGLRVSLVGELDVTGV